MFIMLNASCWTILSVITRQQSTSSRGGVHSAALPRYQGGSRGEAGTALESETAAWRLHFGICIWIIWFVGVENVDAHGETVCRCWSPPYPRSLQSRPRPVSQFKLVHQNDSVLCVPDHLPISQHNSAKLQILNFNCISSPRRRRAACAGARRIA